MLDALLQRFVIKLYTHLHYTSTRLIWHVDLPVIFLHIGSEQYRLYFSVVIF